MGKKEKIFTATLISLGFILRVWRLRELMGFDYDQEVAAFAVSRILSGDLTLIGQEISVGGVFIGPGYYYLLSLFYWLFGRDPIGAGVMVAFISLATMVVLFLLTRELFDTKTALVALLIYATSAKINFYDRTTAPSNPLMLSGLLTIFLLLRIKKGKLLLFPFLATVILFSIIHLHPSAVVLLPLTFVLWKHWHLLAPSKKYLLSAGIAGAIILSPLVLFDLRHGFLNIRGIIKALETPGKEAYFFIFKFLLNLRIQFETFASLLGLGKFNIPVALLIFLVWLIYKDKERSLIGYWILIPAIILSFYSRHMPEYYFLVSLPAWVIFLSRVFYKLKQKAAYLFYPLILLFLLGNLSAIIQSSNPTSLKYKQQVVDFIARSKSPVVSFDTDYGLEYGLRFLLQKAGITLADSKKDPNHVIVIPESRRGGRDNGEIFGGIKVIESQSNKNQRSD